MSEACMPLFLMADVTEKTLALSLGNNSVSTLVS